MVMTVGEKLNIQLFIIYMTVKENLLENLPLLHHAIIGRYKYGIIWKWYEDTIITEYLDSHLEEGIAQKNLDFILDLIDEYCELAEVQSDETLD